MTISLVHQKVSAVADGIDSSVVRPSDWNAEHTLRMATAHMIGRISSLTGPAEELDAAAVRTFIGIIIGSTVQAYAANLDAWALLDPDDYATGSETASMIAAALTDYYTASQIDTIFLDYLTAAQINSGFQPLATNLTEWAGINPSANGASLVAATNYAAMRALLDLEPGTDFYSMSAADTAFLSPSEGNAAYQPIGVIGAAIVTAAAPSANQNDYDPTGWSADVGYVSTLRIAPTTSIIITGIARGVAGRRVCLMNGTAPNDSTGRLILLPNQSVSSSAANRFLFHDNMPRFLMPGKCIELMYDDVFDRWMEVGHSAWNNIFNIAYTDTFNSEGVSSAGAGVSTAFSLYNSSATQNPIEVLRLGTGTTAAGYVTVRNRAGAPIFPGEGSLLWISRVAVDTLSVLAQRYRLISGLIFDGGVANFPDDFIGWTYIESEDLEWQFKTVFNTTTTAGASTVTVDTNYVWLGFFINGNWSSVDFFISQNGVDWTFAGTNTANIPTTGLQWGIKMEKTLGITERFAYCDLWGLTFNPSRGS